MSVTDSVQRWVRDRIKVSVLRVPKTLLMYDYGRWFHPSYDPVIKKDTYPRVLFVFPYIFLRRGKDRRGRRVKREEDSGEEKEIRKRKNT